MNFSHFLVEKEVLLFGYFLSFQVLFLKAEIGVMWSKQQQTVYCNFAEILLVVKTMFLYLP